MVRFKIDYTFWLNIVFLLLGGALLWLHWKSRKAEAPSGEAMRAPQH